MILRMHFQFLEVTHLGVIGDSAVHRVVLAYNNEQDHVLTLNLFMVVWDVSFWVPP